MKSKHRHAAACRILCSTRLTPPTSRASFAPLDASRGAGGCESPDDWSPLEDFDGRDPAPQNGGQEGGETARLDKVGVTLPPDALTVAKKAIKSGDYSDFEERTKARDLHAVAGARSVSRCGQGVVGKNENGVKGATLLRSVVKSGPRKGQMTTSLRGVALCASPWCCPVCGPKIAVSRAVAMEPQAAALSARGWSAWLLTLTVRHSKKNSLAAMFDLFGKAWSGMTSGRSVSLYRKRSGGFEYVRGYDATWSPRNGWHLHFHLVLFFGPDAGNGKDAAAWFLERWLKQVHDNDGDALPRAQDMRPAGNAAAAAAYAMTLAGVGKHTDRHPEGSEVVEDKDGKRYAAASFRSMAEATAAAAKKGRKEGGLTSAELRAGALAGNARQAAAYLEFVRETKGKRAVLVSEGLTLKPEEDAAADEESVSPELAGFLSAHGVQVLDLDNRTGEALAATKAGGKEGGAAVLRHYLGAPGPCGLWQEDPDTAEEWGNLDHGPSLRLASVRAAKRVASRERAEGLAKARASADKTAKPKPPPKPPKPKRSSGPRYRVKDLARAVREHLAAAHTKPPE